MYKAGKALLLSLALFLALFSFSAPALAQNATTTTTTVPFDFSMTLSSYGTTSIAAGGSSSTIATVSHMSVTGAAQPVTLSCSSPSPDITCSFAPASCTPTPTCSFALAFSTSSSLAPGAYSLTVTATGGGISRSQTYNMYPSSATTTTTTTTIPFNFSLSLSSSSGSISKGDPITTGITVSLVSGTAQTVSLSSDSFLPAVSAWNFNPGSCTPPCSSSLTIFTSSSGPAGTYSLSVIGTGGISRIRETYTLTVLEGTNTTSSLPACSSSAAYGAVPSTGCICSGVAYYGGYCCNGIYQSSTLCTPQCSLNSAIPSSGCTCSTTSYYSGYCCGTGSGYYSSSSCASTNATSTTTTTITGLPQCSEGAIPSSGCVCQGNNYYSGNCCFSKLANALVWAGTTPCTQTCPSMGGVCCYGAASDCMGTWNGRWAVDCQGYACCVGTCKNKPPWETTTTTTTYVVTTTTTIACGKDRVEYCKTESECRAASGWWTQNNYCSAQPQTEADCKAAGRWWCNTYCQSGPCPQCSASYTYQCKTEADCKSVGGNWCGADYGCIASFYQCPQCNQTSPGNCKTESTCKGAGANWCSNYCTVASCSTTTTVATTTTMPSATCGNGRCEANEYPSTCFVDCGQYCVQHAIPVCSGFLIKGSADSAGCPGPSVCCGDRLCSGTEDSKNCPQDCGIEKPFCGDGKCNVGEDTLSCAADCAACPQSVSCPDKTERSCTKKDFGCYCDPCPLPKEVLPSGCTQETSRATGAVNVVCTGGTKCPPLPDVKFMERECARSNGTFALSKDQTGCEYPDCQFAREKILFRSYDECHALDEREAIKTKCARLDLSVQIEVQGECKVATCGKPTEQLCEKLGSEQRRSIEEKCKERGMRIVKEFDNSGCPALKCRESFECPKELPEEAYKKCQAFGGEMIIKKDENGCVRFSDCLKQADERDALVDPIERVPEAPELLEMAFKLEELRIKMDKLATQVDKVAKYYESRKSADAERWKRVAGMFKSAVEEVDKIKNELRNKLDTATADDLLEVRRSVRYIRDVLMKDIAYVMLSTSKDVEKIGEKKDCGTDEACFNRAFRRCQPALFLPEGRSGPTVELTGLENNTCVLKASMQAESGLVDMTCRISDYAKGMRNPETDVLPHCEGPMIEALKQRDAARGKG